MSYSSSKRVQTTRYRAQTHVAVDKVCYKYKMSWPRVFHLYFMYSMSMALNAKGMYLVLYSIALRALSLSHIPLYV